MKPDLRDLLDPELVSVLATGLGLGEGDDGDDGD